jgi:hypothetical protein
VKESHVVQHINHQKKWFIKQTLKFTGMKQEFGKDTQFKGGVSDEGTTEKCVQFYSLQKSLRNFRMTADSVAFTVTEMCLESGSTTFSSTYYIKY